MNSKERTQLSLTGLSVGDALGETFFGAGSEVLSRIERRKVPPAPWQYTDVLPIVWTIMRKHFGQQSAV